MVKKKMSVKKDMKSCIQSSNCNGGFYGLGFIGSVIYYISTTGSFWMGVLGILKSIVWPVFVVYGLLKFIGA